MSSSANSEVRIYGVLSNALDEVWHEVVPFLENAIEYSDGKFSLRDTRENLEKTLAQLWVGYDSEGLCVTFVTEIIEYPQKRVLLIKFLGGRRFDTWVHRIDFLREFAYEKGCTAIELYGRPGWEKVLKKFSYQKMYSVLVLDLKGINDGSR